MNVITLNVNGIRSAARKGVFTWLEQQNADFVCLQETKIQRHQLIPHDEFYPAGYTCVYVSAQKPGYSGVAIYARKKPLNIIQGLGFETCDQEGRYVQFDYPRLSVVSIYLPSGSSGVARQAVKYDFLNRLSEHLRVLIAQGRELIICGDINIAHRPIDLKNWRGNQKNSGFLPQERAWMDYIFDELGLVDAFRVKNQEAEQYTWWSNRGQAWQKNVGWRIDYQIITPGLAGFVDEVRIDREPRFSDHAPLSMVYRGEWDA